MRLFTMYAKDSYFLTQNKSLCQVRDSHYRVIPRSGGFITSPDLTDWPSNFDYKEHGGRVISEYAAYCFMLKKKVNIITDDWQRFVRIALNLGVSGGVEVYSPSDMYTLSVQGNWMYNRTRVPFSEPVLIKNYAFGREMLKSAYLPPDAIRMLSGDFHLLKSSTILKLKKQQATPAN